MTPPPTATENRARRAVGARVAALFDEHAGMVLGLCRLLLRDHHEAEDACQQTFVSAYRALLRGTEPREVAPWLAAIARNECRARLRRRARAPLALDDELEIADTASDLAEVADRRAELDLLATEIAKLPSRQREAIALRDFLGLSYEEVASALSVSVPVVESLLFRARRRLRDTVHRVPRYAAGLIVVPFALRAALEKDIPDFGPATMATVAAGATAAGIAKLLSLPISFKAAATTVAVVAAGTVAVPKLLHGPAGAPQSGPAAIATAAGAPADPKPGLAPTASGPARAAGDAAPPAAAPPALPAPSAGPSGEAPAAPQQPPVASASPALAAGEPVRVSSDADVPAAAPTLPSPALPATDEACAPAASATDPATAPADSSCPPAADSGDPAGEPTVAPPPPPLESGACGGSPSAADALTGAATGECAPAAEAPVAPPPPPPAETAPSETDPPAPPPPTVPTGQG